ncbi:MAG TPA: Vms1/Ankzf1 family peptidyl-tRNA hydrolase [Jiangellaceae bacterium]|nr:Vms1/Ankzf1 family peptidyl-tRNA hydrolase [Jiangellaceae bacterium]
MQLSSFQPLAYAAAPVLSAHIDVTRTSANAANEVELRWKSLREQFAQDGAPDAIVGDIEERVLAPTHAPGNQGRTVFANHDGVLLDRVFPLRPMRDIAHVGIAPHLLPMLRAQSLAVPYLLVRLDRAGADITVVDSSGAHVSERQVEGGHDVLHKVPGGGWSQRRYQSRVEDSWERNAATVAVDLDKVVSRHCPSVVLLAGDVRAAAELHQHAGKRTRELLVDLETGGRESGISEEALNTAVENALAAKRQQVMGEVLARFEQEAGRDGAAADGLTAVVDALRGGQADTLLLQDDYSSTATLWGSDNPLVLGTTADEVRALGGTNPTQDRADALLLRALIAQDGGFELVEVDKVSDGVGALLRFNARPPVPGAG